MNNYPYMRPAEPILKGRPVASFEEAKACMIDFDGTVFYFPDLANKRIYTKQINLNGTSSIKVYELIEIPEEVPNSNLVTREEFEKAIQEIKDLLPKQELKF